MLEINRYVQRPAVTLQRQEVGFRRIWSLMDPEEHRK